MATAARPTSSNLEVLANVTLVGGAIVAIWMTLASATPWPLWLMIASSVANRVGTAVHQTRPRTSATFLLLGIALIVAAVTVSVMTMP